MTWDLTSYFPEFNGPDMRRFKEAIRADIASLRQAATKLPALTSESTAAWEDILLRNEDLSRRMSHLSSYVGCLASADARNEAYLQEGVEMTRTHARLDK